jgi:hypothetical protein
LELVDGEFAYIDKSGFGADKFIKLYAEFRKTRGNLKIEKNGNTEYYDSLAEAFAAADNGDVISALTSFSFTGTAEIPAGKTLTLKAEGLSVKNINGGITVKDGGGLKLEAVDGSLIVDGVVNVENHGTIEMAGKLFVTEISLAAWKSITVLGELSLPGGCPPTGIKVVQSPNDYAVLNGSTDYTLTADDCANFAVNGRYIVNLENNTGVAAEAEAKRSSSGKLYATIQEAVADSSGGNAARPNEILVLKNSVTINDTVVINSGKHIKLAPYNGNVTILRDGKFLMSLFTVESGASLTLAGNGGSGLIIDGGKTGGITARAALVKVSGGTFTLNAGVVLQNNDNSISLNEGAGGGVYVYDSGIFTMNGGAISGNTASGNGGGVYVHNGTLTMTGGNISGNTASNGGGVYFGSSGSLPLEGTLFTISGSAVVAQNNDVYLIDGYVINVTGLTGTGLVAKITPQLGGIDTKILDGIDANTIKRFTLNIDGMRIMLANRAGKLCDANGSASSVDTLQAAISATGGSPGSPDTIALLADIDITSTDGTIILASGQHIRLVPNGGARTIKRGDNSVIDSLFTVPNGASLTLSGDGGNDLVIDGGKTGGITAMAALVTVTGGTLTLNAGAVLQNNSNGGVEIQIGGVFEMTGGTVGDNSGGDGGGVYVRDGTFNMSDGVIENNVAEYNGGGVNMGSNGPGGEFNFSGGVIQNNKCLGSYGGGGVSVVFGNFNMSGSAVIKNNEAVTKGGGVCLQSSIARFTMTGGIVYGSDDDNNKNIAAGSGQVLYNESNGTVTINGTPDTNLVIDTTINATIP